MVVHRFVSKDNAVSSYRPCVTLDLSDFTIEKRKAQLIESKLFDYFNKNGLSKVKEDIDSFDRFVTGEVALFEDEWARVEKESKEVEVVTDTCWRFALCCAIYRKNKDISREKYIQFLRRYLTESQGGSSFFRGDDTDDGLTRKRKGYTSVSKSDLSKLGTIQKIIGYCLDDSVGIGKKRKNRNNKQISPGKHISHKKSYNLFGEGDVVIESGVANLSRGTRDIGS